MAAPVNRTEWIHGCRLLVENCELMKAECIRLIDIYDGIIKQFQTYLSEIEAKTKNVV